MANGVSGKRTLEGGMFQGIVALRFLKYMTVNDLRTDSNPSLPP